MTILDDGTDGITELEKFGPERIDGVNPPATGFPFLMLKSTGTAGRDRADTTTEAPIAEPGKPDPVVNAAAALPAETVKGTADTAGTSTLVELPDDMSVSISPKDLARLATFKQRLTVQQARQATAAPEAGGEDVAKRDFDPDTGGGVDRDTLKAGDFVFPDERVFPVVTPGDVTDAVSSWGRYKGPKSFATFKSKLTALAERKGPKFTAELPDSWDGDSTSKAAGTEDDAGAAGEDETAKAKGKGKPFPGAAPPFKGKGKSEKDKQDDDGDSGDDGQDDDSGDGKDESGGDDEDKGEDKAEKGNGRTCPGCSTRGVKGAKFCHKCGGSLGKKTAKAKASVEPQDAKVDQAISALERDAAAALAAQAQDPDARTHPADVKVTEHLQDVKDDVAAAAAAQKLDEATDDPAQHKTGTVKSADAEPPAYHLARLHDAMCAAYRHEDVVIAHPAAAKGIAALVDPAVFAAMTTEAVSEGRASDIPALGEAYHAAVTAKALPAGDLDTAAGELRKAFAEYYPDAHPKPGSLTPGQFRRPYLSAGHANQSARPGQEPRIPMASHVPSAGDFQRPLITAGREAASPGAAKASRTYYTNAARGQAHAALASMHDFIAGRHPGICPMSGVPYDGEDAIPGSAGSSLTTAAPMPEQFGKTRTRDDSVPEPVTAEAAAAVVTPHVTKAEKKALKAAKKAAKAARKEAGAMTTQPAGTDPGPVPAMPPVDRELLKSVLAEVVTEQFGDLAKTTSDLSQRIAELESAPDPAQMAPRSGAASITKARGNGPEVPSGGDSDRETERLVRLVKRAQDPDSGTRTAAIGELIDTAGREAAVRLLAGI